MFGTTMLLTIGQALDRAKDEQQNVRLHIGGEWITGTVLNSDGHGVAVLEQNGDLCVVRQDTITAVRLPRPVRDPFVPPQPQGSDMDSHSEDSVHDDSVHDDSEHLALEPR